MNIKKNILIIFNKTKYITEFILMILFSICIYKFITIKAYEAYWSKSFFVVSLILGILLLANMIYNCIKDKDKIQNMYLNFVIPIGILFITFMLPTYTPDASSHIWRSYEISKGIFVTKVDDNGESKTIIPEVLKVYNEDTKLKTKYFNIDYL